jgi:hypothetical protein
VKVGTVGEMGADELDEETAFARQDFLGRGHVGGCSESDYSLKSWEINYGSLRVFLTTRCPSFNQCPNRGSGKLAEVLKPASTPNSQL